MDKNVKMNFNFPTSIRFGAGVINELADHLKSQKIKNPLVVTDPGYANLDDFKKIVTNLKSAGLNVEVFSQIDKNPIKANVAAGRDLFLSSKRDCVVGIGGGAGMDVARAIVLWASHPQDDLFKFDDAKGGDQYVVNPVPYFVTVPTTSGTGSEVGRSTVISDDITHQKFILFAPSLLAKKVFADPELTLKLPAHITAATGIDALTHNLEAYLSKGFSPLCDGIALEGIRLCFENLHASTHTPNLENRSKMMMAALMGATAFQKGLGVVHSCAHPLSTVFDMHHGLANAIMLKYGLEFNSVVSKERIEFLCQMLGLKKDVNAFIAEIDKLNKSLNLPLTLKEAKVDVTPEKFERLCQLAIEDACHQSNPKVVTKDDFAKIYKKAIG